MPIYQIATKNKRFTHLPGPKGPGNGPGKIRKARLYIPVKPGFLTIY
jgi:hypothetical protein